MSASQIAKQYTRILSQWPKDLLRPNLPFTRVIERRAVPYGVAPVTPKDESSSSKPDIALKPVAPIKATPQEEQAQINALLALLDNRYSKKYPTSPDLLRPTSNPEHYDRLMEEIERAPTKTWLQAKLESWKNKIRWQ